ncbi:hypothetical protein NX059_002276 [Plenodomus lindquistii]|nr:hypothetical protein NX059_002276 [Plenodomus lindquistii]
MAAPRCMRSFLGPTKRAKVTHAPRPYTQTFARAESSDSASNDANSGGNSKGGRRAKTAQKLKANIASGDMALDARLQHMRIDPEEYKTLWRSQQRANERSKEWEPQTRAEAQEKWKQMQDTPDHLTLLHMYKRAGVEPIKVAKERGITLPNEPEPLDPKTQEALDALRTPINVRAVHMRPLRRAPEYGVPVCDLQLRTYSIRNLLLFADFAVRAAYYMGLCARGPIPLPRITERWTVPRANFIFKKSQENFERITMRRLIQIQDGHPDVVKAWLAFLQKHQYHGVGMKANIWEYESLEAATRAGVEVAEGDYERRREGAVMKKVEEILGGEQFQKALKGDGKVEARP